MTRPRPLRAVFTIWGLWWCIMVEALGGVTTLRTVSTSKQVPVASFFITTHIISINSMSFFVFADSWVHCNDSTTTLVSFDQVQACQAYILFYTQRPPHVTSQNTQRHGNNTQVTRARAMTSSGSSVIPKFGERERSLSRHHSGRMELKRRRSNVWWMKLPLLNTSLPPLFRIFFLNRCSLSSTCSLFLT